MHEMEWAGRGGEISTLILRSGFLRFGLDWDWDWAFWKSSTVVFISESKRKERWDCI
jgi:hypothetical protein